VLIAIFDAVILYCVVRFAPGVHVVHPRPVGAVHTSVPSGSDLPACPPLPVQIGRRLLGARCGLTPYWDARLSASRPQYAVVASKVFRSLPPNRRAAIEASGPVKTVRSVINVPESVVSMR
jgi:hypothetical protein